MLKTIVLAAATLAALLGSAAAEEIEVKMLTRGDSGMMVFEPALVRIQPGDTVRFLPSDPGHNAQSRPGMTPEGAEAFKGKIGQAFTVTFDHEGVYGYDCMPHYAMGMVGLVVVGQPVNLDAAIAVKHRGKAAERFQQLFAELAG